MTIAFDNKFNLERVTIMPGEHHGTREERIIATLLGSCVAVAVYDPVNRVGGMNHFMLPGAAGKQFYLSDSGRYGMYAMDLLIGTLVKLGGNRRSFRAKVFGGGSVLQVNGDHSLRVAESNVRFAFEYLETENIPVVSSDVGGTEGRQVLLFTASARVLVRKIRRDQIAPLRSEELSHLKAVRRQVQKPGAEAIVFEDSSATKGLSKERS